jgi:CHAT domain-containing protein
MRGLIDENGEIQKTAEEEQMQAMIVKYKREY